MAARSPRAVNVIGRRRDFHLKGQKFAHQGGDFGQPIGKLYAN